MPMFVVTGIYLAMRIHGAGFMRDIARIHSIVNPLILATPMQRVVTPFALVAEYVKLALWPQVLSSDYSAPSLMPTANPTEPLPLAGILIVGLMGIVLVREWKRRSPVCLVIALLGCSYALVANVLRIGTIFGERLFYWPSLFFFMLIAWAAVRAYTSLVESRSRRAVQWSAAGLAALLVVGMSVRTIIRNTDWADNTTLAIATARDNPRSAKACYWAGTILAMNPDRKWSDVGEMLFKRSVEQYPTFSLSYWELAKLYGRRNELAKSAALPVGGRGIQQRRPGTADGDSRHPVGLSRDSGRQVHCGHGPADPRKTERGGILCEGARRAGEIKERRCKERPAGGDCCTTLPSTRRRSSWRLLQLKTPGLEEQGIHTLKVYLNNVTGSYEANCTVAETLLALDPVRFPAAVDDAEQDIREAMRLAQEHPGLRQLQETLRRKRAMQTAHHGEEHGPGHNEATAGVTP